MPMFERGNVESSAQGVVSVEITLDNGQELVGKIVLRAGLSLLDALNKEGGFIEYQAFDGEQRYISKQALRAIVPMDVPKGQGLSNRVQNTDGFDPFAILGVEQGKPWQEIRSAYLALSKRYHPDRYANVTLPQEVSAYLAEMARRINAAYAALEATRNSQERFVAPRYTPNRDSAARAAA